MTHVAVRMSVLSPSECGSWPTHAGPPSQQPQYGAPSPYGAAPPQAYGAPPPQQYGGPSPYGAAAPYGAPAPYGQVQYPGQGMAGPGMGGMVSPKNPM